MRFRETTSEVLSMVVDTPGHRDHGKTLRDALPGMANIRRWSATHGGYTWSIMFEPGESWWSEEEKKAHVGYSATYCREEHRTISETIAVDGGPFPTRSEAEQACERAWRQIRAVN